MLTRSAVGGRAPSFRSTLVASLLLAGFALPTSAGAQAPGGSVPGQPAPGPASAGPAASGAPAPADVAGKSTSSDGAPQEAAAIYGKIVVDTARLRCWSSAVATPPAFEDVLSKDQIVRLGRSENGFRAVILPLGPIGYVSKRFSKEADDGTVTTKGTKVAFRYRPRTSEAPVAQMPDGTLMHVISIEDGWYKVRIQNVEAWVAAAEVQVVASDPDVVAAYGAFQKKMQAEVQVRLDAIAAEQEQKQQDRIDMEAVQVIEDAFQKEMAKATGDQQFAPIQVALGKVVSQLAEKGQARVACAALKKRMETQQWIVEALEVRNTKPPVVTSTKPARPKDRLERFESIGWVRYESRLAGPGVYYLEKGGRRQHLLSCRTGRFDLSLFVGREVGVIGPRRTPIAETLSVVDVERMEVLGATSR